MLVNRGLDSWGSILKVFSSFTSTPTITVVTRFSNVQVVTWKLPIIIVSRVFHMSIGHNHRGQHFGEDLIIWVTLRLREPGLNPLIIAYGWVSCPFELKQRYQLTTIISLSLPALVPTSTCPVLNPSIHTPANLHLTRSPQNSHYSHHNLAHFHISPSYFTPPLLPIHAAFTPPFTLGFTRTRPIHLLA